MTPVANEQQIRAHDNALYEAWGWQHWWPARSPFEVIVGAYLTQNTSWKNVEIACAVCALRPAKSRSYPHHTSRAARVHDSAGRVLQAEGGSAKDLCGICRPILWRLAPPHVFAQSTETLRQELLSLNGVGPETADSILLYSGQHPVFVVDAYKRRIVERHGIAGGNAKYEELRELFERALGSVAQMPAKLRVKNQKLDFTSHSPCTMSLALRSPVAQVYNDMHGLIVAVGKHYCLKAQPRCERCPLREFLPYSGVNL
jgi:endonuclease-3 related protein